MTSRFCPGLPHRHLARGLAFRTETDRFRAALRQEAETGTPNPDLPWPSRYAGVYQDRRRACGPATAPVLV